MPVVVWLSTGAAVVSFKLITVVGDGVSMGVTISIGAYVPANASVSSDVTRSLICVIVVSSVTSADETASAKASAFLCVDPSVVITSSVNPRPLSIVSANMVVSGTEVAKFLVDDVAGVRLSPIPMPGALLSIGADVLSVIENDGVSMLVSIRGVVSTGLKKIFSLNALNGAGVPSVRPMPLSPFSTGDAVLSVIENACVALVVSIVVTGSGGEETSAVPNVSIGAERFS